MNATFDWIKDNLKHEIDFVIWTGDSARHDNDESIPRTPKQVVELNEMVVNKFIEVWGKDDDDDDPTNDMMIPIVPTFGNNDILPHNIFTEGPNAWTRKYLDVWRHFIPEEQRHQFQRGGWYHVEVIPGKLAAVSLNTMYFYTKNAAVDGCAPPSEPGYEHFEWLRIQLDVFRQRGMKVILMGHVPPARTDSKISWDETCWQKYALWLEQYRDIIVASLYGHMNIEHFMIQDFKDIKKSTRGGKMKEIFTVMEDDDFSVQSDTSYLMDLRSIFSDLVSFSSFAKGKKDARYLKKIGGKYGERYAVSHVAQSVVPNYFPTLRVFEYDITGLEDTSFPRPGSSARLFDTPVSSTRDLEEYAFLAKTTEELKANRPKTDVKRKKHKFHLPVPPTKSTPPGPAYSSQTFSLKGYEQYYANLTFINNDFTGATNPSLITKDLPDEETQRVHADKWNPGKHHGKLPEKDKPKPKAFEYIIEYATAEDKFYKLKDLSVRSYLDLAARIGKKVSSLAADGEDSDDVEQDLASDASEMETSGDEIESLGKGGGKKKKKHKKKHTKHKNTNKIWYAFIKRAFAGALDPEDIEDRFGEVAPNDTLELDLMGAQPGNQVILGTPLEL